MRVGFVLRFGDTIGESRPPGELPRLLRARLRPRQARPRRVQPASRTKSSEACCTAAAAIDWCRGHVPRNPAKKAQPPRSPPRAHGPRRRLRQPSLKRGKCRLESGARLVGGYLLGARSMTATCELIRSQIRPSLPISRRRQAISRSTRAPLRTGARRCSSARLSSASAADCWAASTAPRMAASASFKLFLAAVAAAAASSACCWCAARAFLKEVFLPVEVCFLLKALFLLRGEALLDPRHRVEHHAGVGVAVTLGVFGRGTSGPAKSP